jgi:hypothetical protein
MKVEANNFAKIMRSTEALSVDFYRYYTQVHKMARDVKVT